MPSVNYRDMPLEERLAAFNQLEAGTQASAFYAPLGESLYTQSTTLNPDEGQKHAATARSSLITFEEDMSSQNALDIETATVYAQAKADAYHDREFDMQGWHDRYLDTLGRIGWNLTSNQLKEITTDQPRFTIEQLALHLMSLATVGSGQSAAVLLESLRTSLTSLARHQLATFNRHAIGQRGGGFQLLPCGETQSGAVKVLISCCFYKTTTRQTSLLFVPRHRSEIQIYGSAQMCTVNREMINLTRDGMIKAIGKRRKEDFEKIRL